MANEQSIGKIILLAAKTGLYFAHVDGEYDTKEKEFIDNYIQKLSEIGPVDDVKDEIIALTDKSFTLDEVVADTRDLLEDFNGLEKMLIRSTLTQFAKKIIKADGTEAPAEKTAYAMWKEAIKD